ncbi:MAG: hypothetical protein KIT34_16450 [Cyanobacteria bacterium TGS_CYA1]|nr:hypothetical protein [Cyanobacteria bacterium TGS_CYA1]
MKDINLDDIRIAAPCKVPWESMKGTDTKRYCSQCHLNVYNISEMTPSEAVKLVGTDTGYCFSLYRRPDGTVITSDCPVGVAKLQRYMKWSIALVGSFLTGSILFQNFMAKELEEERERRKVYEAATMEMGAKLQAKGKVVICIKDIREGYDFTSDSLEEREIDQAQIPMDAMTSACLLSGRVAKYDISAGHIISQNDMLIRRPGAYRLRLDKQDEEVARQVASFEYLSLSELLSKWIREKLF